MTLFASPLAHPTVMMRPDRLRDAGLAYDEAIDAAEDYDLWERACSKVTLANVPEFLLNYRLHPGQVTASRPDRQRKASDAIRRRALRRFGIAFTEREFALHCDLTDHARMEDPDRAREALLWLRKLGKTARKRGDRAVATACESRSKSLRRQQRRARRNASGPGILRRLVKERRQPR